MLKYDTVEQAQMRLGGSTITYKDRTVYVREVNVGAGGRPHLIIESYPLRTVGGDPFRKKKEYEIVSADDPELNFRIFMLGYCNDTEQRQASYLTRRPQRQQIQGLTRQTVVGLSSESLFWSQSFDDMLFGRYPTPAEAWERITTTDDPWTSVAIARDFAVARDPDFKQLMKLEYRSTPVGIKIDGSAFRLSEKFQYLKELISEHNIPFTLI